METTEAIGAALATGQTAEVRTVLESAATAAQDNYQAINADRDHSREWKAQQLAAVQEKHAQAVNDQLGRIVTADASANRSDMDAVFGLKGIAGDPASLTASRRDAGDRVAAVDNTRDLSAMLRRAETSGDEVLARACVQRAVEIHDSATVNAFIASHPNLEAATERLWTRGTSGTDIAARVVIGALASSLKPNR